MHGKNVGALDGRIFMDGLGRKVKGKEDKRPQRSKKEMAVDAYRVEGQKSERGKSRKGPSKPRKNMGLPVERTQLGKSYWYQEGA